MLRAQAQTVILRPADNMFNFIAVEFFKNYPRWSPEVIELQPTSDGPIRLGTTGRQIRIDQGRRTESKFRVCRYEQGRCVAFEGSPGPFYTTYLLEPVDQHTRLTFIFELSRLEFYMRPFEKLIRVAIRDGAERVTRNLKALIESDLPTTMTETHP